MLAPIRAPFPYPGGKSRAASLIWARMGNVPNWVSPFFGSGAVELARPHPPKVETLGDRSANIANFFRAVAADPHAVAHYADQPSNEADLVARHNWLLARHDLLRAEVMADPFYFDARAAGWWVWGASNAIGTSWHAGRPTKTMMPDALHARGVSRRSLAGRAAPSSNAEGLGFGSIFDWFEALAGRLRGATVVCGEWDRLMGPTICGYADSSHGSGMSPTGILLDPPYPEGARDMYGPDDGAGLWYRVADWAAEHGKDKSLRIALCGYEGTWEPPPGWDCVAWKAKGGFAGMSDAENVNARRERIWFSPGCLGPMPLFAGVAGVS